jgi:Ricin-type beta-trefoil lectin domain
MILNILLIIILLVLFFRIFFDTNSIEYYQNPFIYDNYPIIDKNILSYTPPPYFPQDNTPSLIATNAKNLFLENNNKLILEYSDDSNYTINDPRVKSVKLLLPVEKELKKINDPNNCLDSTDYLSMKLCNGNNNQKWTLFDNNLLNKNNKCISYDSTNRIVMEDCSRNIINQQWVPDSSNRIHSLNLYSKCLEINNSSVILNDCSVNNDNQTWIVGN